MHIPTHIMSGWCVANLFDLTPRERLFSMIAASAADCDGIGRIFGEQTYWHWHHIAGHNLAFGVLVSLVLAAFSTHRLKAFFIYLALDHVHLLMDSFGSGPDWGINYFWPVQTKWWVNPSAWAFFSWQNMTAAAVLLAWTILIAATEGRTPLELITPDLDRRFVQWARQFSSRRADRA